MAPPSVSQVALRNTRNMRVVVVLDDLANHYDTSTAGHDYAFEEMRSYFKQTFVRVLKGLVADTRFVSAPGFDLYVHPTLAMRMDGAFAKSCFAEFGLTIVDGAGKQLASGKSRGEGTFANMADGGAACDIALAQAVGAVLRAALADLDAALAP